MKQGLHYSNLGFTQDETARQIGIDRVMKKKIWQWDWKIKNPEKVRKLDRKRRLQEKHLFEDFTIEEWKQKVEQTKGICPICNRPYKEGHGLSLDHTPPISKAPVGYHYTIDDVTPMCISCNCSKWNRR